MKHEFDFALVEKGSAHMRLARLLASVLIISVAAFAAACAGSRKARIQPPSVAGKPYVSEYCRLDQITVWIVNGQYVRENLDVEFTNFGQHYRFHFIPLKEFWLDQQYAPGEEPFFIDHLLVEHRLMAGGTGYDKALEQADKAEKSERSKSSLAQEGGLLSDSGLRADVIRRIHKALLNEYSTGVRVWVVDGELVRDLFFIDFTEGGHDKVYAFVPDGEIWIDDDVMPEERKFILLHEMHERYLMSNGWRYPKAHLDSSRIEYYCRNHSEELDGMLKREIERNRASATRF